MTGTAAAASAPCVRATGDQVTVQVSLVGVGMRGMNGSRRYAEGLLSGLRAIGTRFAAERIERISWRGRQTERLLIGARALLGVPQARTELAPLVIHAVESVSVPARRNVPIIVTAHDMCALVKPDWVPVKLSTLKHLTWKRCHTWDAVIVPSIATREDVMRLGIPEGRIAVIRHGMSPVFSSPPSVSSIAWVEERLGRSPFVLAAGAPSKKKGSDVLLRAWARIGRSVRGARLAWVGARRSSAEGASGGVVPLGQVTDDELVALYQCACAVVVPSRYEGYSLCVAEALAAGTPVIASDIPAHREFGSKGVHLFRSEDDEELAQLLLLAFDRRLIGERVTFPTWEECARAHTEVYARVASA